MPKPASDDLFRLIQALSKSEKRHFKLQVTRTGGEGEKKFVKLFDLIHNQKRYDEEKLLRNNTWLNPAQLPNLKVQLYKQVMLSVRLCNMHSSADVMIRDLCDNAQLLYDKGLYKQCMQMLDKARKMAVLHDRETLHLDILELEKKVLNQTTASRNDTRVRAVVKESRAVGKSIRNINLFSNLSLKLHASYVKMGFIRSSRDLEKAEELFIRSMPRYEEEKLGFFERLYLYQCYAQYNYFIQDFERVQQYAGKWVELFEKDSRRIPTHPEQYIRALNYLLMAENKLMHYDSFYASLKKLVALKRNKEIEHTENISLVLFRTIYVHEINRHFMLGEFRSGTRVVAALRKEFETLLPQLDKHYVLIFYYKIACLYFGAGEHARALSWLNKITRQGEEDLRLDIHSFARILALICQYELENFDALEYQIKSTYRYLHSHGNLGSFQHLILGFIRGLMKGMEAKELPAAFLKLKKDMLKLNKDPFGNKAFVYFDMISWLESKLEGRTVQEVIKEKALRRIKM
ncbi:MAG TPA: hypothetical protein VNZ86_12175 [Bacteroidia bacterium]|jgi:hypothetical protein|nr:hypothetical protein [Bacteroidia bacterium]